MAHHRQFVSLAGRDVSSCKAIHQYQDCAAIFYCLIEGGASDAIIDTELRCSFSWELPDQSRAIVGSISGIDERREGMFFALLTFCREHRLGQTILFGSCDPVRVRQPRYVGGIYYF